MNIDPRALIRPWLIPLSVCLVIGLLAGGGWWGLVRQQTDTLAQFVPTDAPVYLHFSFPRQRQGEHTPVTLLANTILNTLAQTLFADLPGILTDEYGQLAFNRELAVGLTIDHRWFALVRVTKHQAADEYDKAMNRFVTPRVLLAGDIDIIDQLNTSTHRIPSLAPTTRQPLTLPAPFLTGKVNTTAIVPSNDADLIKATLRSFGTDVKLRVDWAGRSWLTAKNDSTAILTPLLTTALPPKTAITVANIDPVTILTSLSHGQLDTWAALTKATRWSTDQARFWQRPMQFLLTRPIPSTIGWTIIMPRLANETSTSLATNLTLLLAARYPTLRRHTLPDGSISQELVPPTATIVSAPIFDAGRKLTAPNGETWYLAANSSFFFFGDDSAAIKYLLTTDLHRPMICLNQTNPGVAVALSELSPVFTNQTFFVGSGSTELLSGCIGSPQ